MNNKFILESLASDLKRVALGLHRGSYSMAKRFLEEAMKRKKEVDMVQLPPYLQRILNKLDNSLDSDDALMYSTLIQNYTQSSNR